MNTALAALTGTLLAASVLLLISGLTKTVQPARGRPRLTPAQLWARSTRRPPGRAGRRRDLLLITSLTTGLTIFALTGWLLAIPLLPLIALGTPKLLGSTSNSDVPLLEALDRWVRTIAATLPVGRDVIDSIRVSLGSAPPLLADDLAALVDELNSRVPAADALTHLADRLDNPESDAVIASLILATRRTGNGLTASLSQLADNIQERLRALRDVERERDLPRTRIRQVTLIAAVMVGCALLLGDYMRPYSSPFGQFVLAGLIGSFVACLVIMYRMTIPRRRDRILITTPAGSAP